MKYSTAILLLFITTKALCQTFYYGNDLSYVNQMEDCGADFKEDSISKDVYSIFADHGTNLVRVRMWKNPDWQNSLVQPDGVKEQYNDFADVKETIRRAKQAGMEVMLGFHFSDFWADPGRQAIPDDWLDVASDIDVLSDSVYNYVYQTLSVLDSEGIMPEIVKIGNENNSGMLLHTGLDSDYDPTGTVNSSWTNQAKLFNTGIQAVRDISDSSTIKPKVALHMAGISKVKWWYSNITSKGVTDFDIIGFSYYYAWHGGSISELGQIVNSLATTYPDYEVMVVETGYLWSIKDHDSLGNIITTPDPEYLPVIPEKQLEYMVDMTRTVKQNGGTGVIFWEPAWVSTPCSTPWGQGSSHDHVVFFDPDSTNFMENGGGKWMEERFYEDIDALKVTFIVDMTNEEVANEVYIAGSFTDEPIQMADEGNGTYSYFTYLATGETGGYYFINGDNELARETVPSACATYEETDRLYEIGASDIEYSAVYGQCDEQPVPDEVEVTFLVDMTDQDVSRGVYIVGEINDWEFTKMTNISNNIYKASFNLSVGDALAYYFITTNNWNSGWEDYRETIPEECALSDEIMEDTDWNTDRAFIVPVQDTTIGYVWGSCQTVEATPIRDIQKKTEINVFPNPVNTTLFIENQFTNQDITVEVLDISGRAVKSGYYDKPNDVIQIDVSGLFPGMYVLKVISRTRTYIGKFMRGD